MEEGFPKIFYDNIPAFSENYIIDVFIFLYEPSLLLHFD